VRALDEDASADSESNAETETSEVVDADTLPVEDDEIVARRAVGVIV
jgi:hypothetical protein